MAFDLRYGCNMHVMPFTEGFHLNVLCENFIFYIWYEYNKNNKKEKTKTNFSMNQLLIKSSPIQKINRKYYIINLESMRNVGCGCFG